jgi:hypothetical protein
MIMILILVRSSVDYAIGLFSMLIIRLDKVYPPKGQAEDRARTEGEEASENEEETEEQAEEETHEDRDYNEDRLKL